MNQDKLKARIKAKTTNSGALFTRLALPDECMIWEGATTKAGMQFQRNRGYFYMTNKKPISRILFQGRRQSVPRVIHQLMTGETETEFRGQCLCGHSLCVNPRHWKFQIPAQEINLEPEPNYNANDPWTMDEASEVYERFLAYGNADVLLDIPEDLLEQLRCST